MCAGKQLHQARQGMVLFVEWQVQEHSAPSSGKYSAACQALASSNVLFFTMVQISTDRALLGTEERWFLGPNSLPS